MVRRSCGGCCCGVERGTGYLFPYFFLHLALPSHHTEHHTEHHTGTDHEFELEKITFHVNGEHTYNGVKPAMEMHLVRVSTFFWHALLSEEKKSIF